MKFSNKIIVKICFPIILLIALSGCDSKFGYRENKIYSENIVPNYNKDSRNKDIEEYITREDAIKRSVDLFKVAFKIDIDKNSLYEVVSLNKRQSDFIWDISWSNNKNDVFTKEYYKYYTSINSVTGEIIEAGVLKFDSKINENYNYDISISKEKVKEILMPLVEILNIEIDDFSINTESNYEKIIVTLIKENYVYRFGIDKYNNNLMTYSKHYEGYGG